jgi:hypothetical protein
LAEAQDGGWFGKVVKPEGRGTSNVGISAARTASRLAILPTSSQTMPSSRGRRAAPRPPSPPRSPKATRKPLPRPRLRSRTTKATRPRSSSAT